MEKKRAVGFGGFPKVLEAKKCSFGSFSPRKGRRYHCQSVSKHLDHLDTSTQKWPRYSPSELLNILQGSWNIPNPNTAFWKATPLKELPYIVRCLLCLIHPLNWLNCKQKWFLHPASSAGRKTFSQSKMFQGTSRFAVLIHWEASSPSAPFPGGTNVL